MKIYFLNKLFLILLGSGLGSAVCAQEMVSGIVMDAETKEPLLGVHVTVDGTDIGTITNELGFFELTTALPHQLTFSFIGYDAESIEPGEEELRVFLKQNLVELNQLIVSASRESQRRTDIPMAISKLSPRAIEETKAASLEQLINKVSGVFMVNLGNEQHGMSIRQPISLKSLFLYLEDGIPIRPTGVFNHNALTEINMGAVKTIEVIKGPASSIYGSEAIGGSINFITKGATASPIANISIQGDNLGYKRSDFEAGKKFGKLGLYLGGYYANRNDGFREHSDFNKLALTLKGDLKIGKRDKLTTAVSLIEYEAEMTGSIDSASFYSRNYPSMHTFTKRKINALRVRSTFDHYWSDKSKTVFTVFYRNNSIFQNPSYRIKNSSENPLKASGEINKNVFQSYGSIIQHTQELGFWDGRLIGGLSLDYSPNTYFAEYINVNRNENGIYTGFSLSDSSLTDYEVALLNTAAYTQLELSPLTALRFVLALRYDHFNYNYSNNLSANSFSGAPDSRDNFQNLSPKIGFTYDFGKERGIYGNYSIGFVPPQVSELYRGVKVPVLEPSVYKNYEVGGWLAFAKKGYFDLSLYQLHGSNEVINVLLDDGTRENRNAGKTLHQGIEYSIQYSPVKSVKLRFGGTNARHEYVEYIEQGRAFNGKRMEAAPAWIANAEVFYYPPFVDGVRIGMEWQHFGPYYMDAANTEKYEGFDLVNLRLGYEYKGFEIWCNAMNIGDVLYATSAGKVKYGKEYNPGDPRTFSLGIGYGLK